MSLKDDRIIYEILDEFLEEDIQDGDITTDAVINEEISGIGKIIAKEDGIIAGLEAAEILFELIDEDLRFHHKVKDGDSVKNGDLIAVVAGNLASILSAERVVLNFIQRMSGIATTTAKYVKEVEGTKAKVFDTRKTVPGLRLFDKMAVKLGGGENHRFGLYDMFLIKENHIAAAGGIKNALDLCYEYRNDTDMDCKIEIEVRNLEELNEVLESKKADIVLLDNFTIDEIRKAISIIDNRIESEASGGITLNNIREIALTGVNRISVGALTHSIKALDISLLIEK
jgi:nicotinate-nucleotide pyrophosphorylase (carboxylating)